MKSSRLSKHRLIVILGLLLFFTSMSHALPTKNIIAKDSFIVKLKPSYTEASLATTTSIQSMTRVFREGLAPQDVLEKMKSKKASRGQMSAMASLQLDRQIQAQDERVKKLKKRLLRVPKNEKRPDLSRIIRIKFDRERDDMAQIIKDYASNPAVEYAEPNYKVKAFTLPNDTYVDPNQDGQWSTGSWGQRFEDMWGLKSISMDMVWNMSNYPSGNNIIVAVIDTGVDYYHEDMAGNMWVNAVEIAGNNIDDDGDGYTDDVYGYDFFGASGNALDDNGHGSHVAGTIAAIGGNGKGIIGVVPSAKIMALKGLDSKGSGYTSYLADAIRYAVDHGADVINNSWGGEGYSLLLEDAVNYAHAEGCVIIAAAGNENVDASSLSPANIKNVITVAAVDHQNHRASFSNYGVKIDVAAPGGGEDATILSLKAGGTILGDAVSTNYRRLRGTSMAAPHVAGLAALILSAHPEITNEEVRQAIRHSANDLGPAGFDTQ